MRGINELMTPPSPHMTRLDFFFEQKLLSGTSSKPEEVVSRGARSRFELSGGLLRILLASELRHGLLAFCVGAKKRLSGNDLLTHGSK